jgi:hypothetical protein
MRVGCAGTTVQSRTADILITSLFSYCELYSDLYGNYCEEGATTACEGVSVERKAPPSL